MKKRVWKVLQVLAGFGVMYGLNELTRSFWLRDVMVWTLRIVGGLGTLYVSFELMRIFWILDNARLKHIVYKVLIFFFIFGLLKLSATGLDSIMPEGIYGSLVNNLLIFWLVFFFRKRRITLESWDTETKSRVSSTINVLVDEMKFEQLRVQQFIQSS